MLCFYSSDSDELVKCSLTYLADDSNDASDIKGILGTKMFYPVI